MTERLTPGGAAKFRGFASPTSNTLYCPNQFFDVCLPHRSRGCVRIVAYMLRKTLGWSDAQGNPIHEHVAFTYDELIRKAGVSRDAIKAALTEAQQFGFIRCLLQPSPNQAGKPAVTGLYELRWDESTEYIKDPALFSGFFAGEGNRTYVPNQYFDVVVRQETLAVAKVVGSIARFSIGWANKFGHRRTQASMSFLDLRRYAKITDATTLTGALRHALSKHYLRLVSPGVFDKSGGRHSTAAVYALQWLNDNADAADGQKTRAEMAALSPRSENQTENGQKTRAGERSENQSGLLITTTNKTLKQRSASSTGNTAGAAESVAACFETLKREGFDEPTARRFAKAYPIQQVLNQIDWLPQRGPTRNRLGLLRRAIEQNYPKPGVQKSGRPDFQSPDADLRQRLAYKLTLRSR
jgi:hypothetical protein